MPSMTNSGGVVNGGHPNESTRKKDYKSYEDLLKAREKSDPELVQIILSHDKKHCGLEERINKMEKSITLKNQDLHYYIHYQAGEIYKKDERIRQLEEELAEEKAINRNLRGWHQPVVENVVDQTVDNTGDGDLEEMAILAAENINESEAGSSSHSFKIERRGRPKKRNQANSKNTVEVEQIAVPVLETQKGGEMTPKTKERPLTLIKKERKSDNKENDQTTPRQRQSPRVQTRMATPEGSKMDKPDDGTPSLSKAKRQKMTEQGEIEQPPAPFPEEEPMVADENEEVDDEKILYSSQWLRHVTHNSETNEVWCSMTGEPLSQQQTNLALERATLLSGLRVNLTPIAVLVHLRGWTLKCRPHVEEVKDALERLKSAGLLKQRGGLYEIIKHGKDMKKFKRALAQRGFSLEEYQQIFQ